MEKQITVYIVKTETKEVSFVSLAQANAAVKTLAHFGYVGEVLKETRKITI